MPRFNPRTPAGCDSKWYTSPQSSHVFQPTHPCGVRLLIFDRPPLYPEFQPTHPCGVRLEVNWIDATTCGVSTHAPLRGATPLRNNLLENTRCFNPRTPAGCDDGESGYDVILFLSFNPRTPAGCDYISKLLIRK